MSSFNSIREAAITQITPETIRIVRSREELVFKFVTAGLYRSFDRKEIIVNNTGENRLRFEFVSWFSIYFYIYYHPQNIGTHIMFFSLNYDKINTQRS